MREMTIEEAKKIQVEILRELDAFCRNNNINYSIAYGTLIGAVRDKGYIPWDDDIDVTMLRPDFEKFISSFKSSKYALLKPMRSKRWEFFARVVDPNTVVKFPQFPESPFGVWLTIFPIDTKPDDELLWIKQKKNIDRYALLARIKCAVLAEGHLRNIIKKICRFCTQPIPLSKINKRVHHYATYYEGMHTKNKIVWVSYNRYETHASELFESYIDIQFEDMTVKAMVGYDRYLKNVYGDYMKLPPIEERVQTHAYKAYYLDR